MITPKEHFHGSDLEKIESVYGIKKEDIVSFSANVNPLGISPKLKETLADKIDAITGYPDREYTELRESIAAYLHTSFSKILVGNGSTELISIFIQIIKPKKALILSPTYSEYEREISLAGGECKYFQLKENMDFKLDINSLFEELSKNYNMLVICNPNNPTSQAIQNKDMEVILKRCQKNNIICMVDETYVEFAEDMENITSVSLTENHNNLIILRGVSKFFAAPGLRLGYAVLNNKELADKVNAKKNPWSINTLAEIAGKIMFSDKDYIHRTKTIISCERNRICTELRKCPRLKVYNPVANFVLIKILDGNITSQDVFDGAIKKGMMLRDCSNFPYLDNSFFRFCFMSPKDNTRLLEYLMELFK